MSLTVRISYAIKMHVHGELFAELTYWNFNNGTEKKTMSG